MPRAYDEIDFACPRCGQRETVKIIDKPKTPENKFKMGGSVECCKCGTAVHGFIQ